MIITAVNSIPRVVFEKIPGFHDDDRRMLTPVFNMDIPGFKGVKQLNVAAMKRDGVLGRHYHDYAELFAVLNGKAVFRLNDDLIGEKHEYELVPGYRLLIPAGVWHEAQVDGGTILIGLTEERYVSPEHNDHKN
ncbi:MAG: cupin domain-containing protein [bacterium]|nr:cupin domain-containing protein [bacterium]